MMQPKKRKYRKEFRGKMSGIATRGNTLAFGDYGIKALECGWVSANELESARRTISHHTKRGGKVWIRVFPDKPTTKKAAGVRMGSGKGDIDKYVAVIRPGRVLFELSGLDNETSLEALRRASHKISVATKIIARK